MTTFRVEPESVLGMGAALVDLAESLVAAGDPAADRWALGPGEVAPAVEDLLGGWRHARLQLAQALAGLGDAAAEAGGLYLETESGVGRSLVGGSW